MVVVYSLYLWQNEWVRLAVTGWRGLVLQGVGVLQGPVQDSKIMLCQKTTKFR